MGLVVEDLAELHWLAGVAVNAVAGGRMLAASGGHI